MNEYYPFFALREMDWQAAYDRYSKSVTSTRPYQFAKPENKMVKPLKDCAVLICQPGISPFPDFDPPTDWTSMASGLTFNIEKNSLKDAKWTSSGRLMYGTLNSSTGYIYIKYLDPRGLTDDQALLTEYEDVFKSMKALPP